MPTTDALEAQKARSLHEIAQTLQLILNELRSMRVAQQTIASRAQ